MQVVALWLLAGLVVGSVLFVVVGRGVAAVRATQEARERAEARLLWRDWALGSSTRTVRRSVARRG